MPVVITFDIESAEKNEYGRIQSFFERFGWENLGGTSYRYPRLGTADQPVEDWLNHIVPALMLFRTFFISTGRTLKKFTLDAQSSSGYSPITNFGHAPTNEVNTASSNDVNKFDLYDPSTQAFGKSNLLEWLQGIEYPY